MLAGIAFGLSTAWVWATTSLWAKGHSTRIHPLSFNAFRLVPASLFFLLLLPFFGGWDAFAQISLPARLALVGSTLLGVCFGDTLYFWSMTHIGASRALPISGIYPLFTWALAVPLLGEPVTVPALIGTAFVLISLYLLAPPPELDLPEHKHFDRAGVLAAIGAAVLWAAGTTMMKYGLESGINVVAVNAFRLPLGALVLLAMAQLRGRSRTWDGCERGDLPGLIGLSLYSNGLGAILWVLAVDLAGAARASLLNTVSPLIGVPLSAIFLHERVTARVALGAILSVIGIIFIL